MEVVLLERVEKLGQMGDVVNVKPGFARNFHKVDTDGSGEIDKDEFRRYLSYLALPHVDDGSRWNKARAVYHEVTTSPVGVDGL